MSNTFLDSTIFGICEDGGIGVTHNVEYMGIDIRNPTD